MLQVVSQRTFPNKVKKPLAHDFLVEEIERYRAEIINIPVSPKENFENSLVVAKINFLLHILMGIHIPKTKIPSVVNALQKMNSNTAWGRTILPHAVDALIREEQGL